MVNLKISNKISEINFWITIDLILLAAAVLFFNYSDLDVNLQNHFFNFSNKTWLVDANEPIKKAIFYKMPKILLGAAIFIFFVLTIFAFRSKKPGPFIFHNRHRFALIFLGFALIPLIAGNIKKFTNIYCPNQLIIYDGNYAYSKIIEKNPNLNVTELRKGNLQNMDAKPGKCFPAGHAVTGFTLMILFFVFEKKSHRIIGLLSGVIMGWICGIYQMLKGVHFLSDTVVSMLVCFLLAALISHFYYSRIVSRPMRPNKFVVKSASSSNLE